MTDKEYKKLLKEYITGLCDDKNIYINLADLVKRLEMTDKEYESSPWNLLQILANVNQIEKLKINSKKNIISNKLYKSIYREGVTDALDVVIEEKFNEHNFKQKIKGIGKYFGVEVMTLDELIQNLPD